MLSIRNLVKIYPGPVAALVGVDLDVPERDVRPAGSQRGWQDDPDATSWPGSWSRPRARRRSTANRCSTGPSQSGAAGLPPQDFGFFPHLTGERMLRYLLRLKGVRSPLGEQALCGELLDRVHLSFAARRKVKTYSGGMRQRLGIAQAIAGDPRLIIVDEPTAGLDPEERLRFYRLLSELAEDRIVLLSTHIVEDVAVLCPRFAVIRDGRLIADTTPGLARRAIEGTIYEGTIPAESYDRLLAESEHCVTQAYLVEGHNRVRVYQPDGCPPPGFAPVGANPGRRLPRLDQDRRPSRPLRQPGPSAGRRR